MTLKQFDHAPIEFRVTRDECAFQPVLDSFQRAENIWIVTYNVTKGSHQLFEAIRKTNARTTLISNIPGRSERYYGRKVDGWRASARSQITDYLSLLDPNSFSGNVETWFCFRNHAKIIMTDHVAFVGSANFSSASSNNWEAGVIVRDSTTIAQLVTLVEEIKNDSIRFLGNISIDFMRPLAVLKQCKDTIDSKMSEESFDDLGFGLHELRLAVGEGDELWAECEEVGGPLTSIIDMDLLERLEAILESADALREYAEFDPDKFDVEDFPSDAYGDRLETYMQSALESNSERLEELESEAIEDLELVKHSLRTLCEQVEQVVSVINKAKSIDNTK